MIFFSFISLKLSHKSIINAINNMYNGAYFIRLTAVLIGRLAFAVFVPLPGPMLKMFAAGCGVALN